MIDPCCNIQRSRPDYEAMFRKDATDLGAAVNRLFASYITTQGQFDALVLVAFQYGASGTYKILGPALKAGRTPNFSSLTGQQKERQAMETALWAGTHPPACSTPACPHSAMGSGKFRREDDATACGVCRMRCSKDELCQRGTCQPKPVPPRKSPSNSPRPSPSPQPQTYKFKFKTSETTVCGPELPYSSEICCRKMTALYIEQHPDNFPEWYNGMFGQQFFLSSPAECCDNWNGSCHGMTFPRIPTPDQSRCVCTRHRTYLNCAAVVFSATSACLNPSCQLEDNNITIHNTACSACVALHHSRLAICTASAESTTCPCPPL
jgi:hypothetical protein